MKKDPLRMRHRAVSARVAAARADASPNLGLLLVELAELRTELGLPREADVLLDEASALDNVSRDLVDRIDAARLGSLARVGDELRDRNEVEAAIERYEQALPLARRLEDGEAKAQLAFEVARCHHLAGRPAEAAPWFEEARRRCEDGPDPDGAAICTWLCAEMKRRSGEIVAARALYEDAAARFSACGEHMEDQLASCLRSLGRVCRLDADDPAALPAFERALAIARGRDDRINEGWALLEIGWLKSDAGERFHAAARFLEAEQKFRDLGETEGEAYAAEGLGEISYLDDRNHEAIEYLTRALALYEEAEALDMAVTTLVTRARALHDLHRHAESGADHARVAAIHRANGEWRRWLGHRLHAFGEAQVLALGHRVGWLDGKPRAFRISPIFFFVCFALGLASGLVVSSWGKHPGRVALPIALLACALATIQVFRWLSRR